MRHTFALSDTVTIRLLLLRRSAAGIAVVSAAAGAALGLVGSREASAPALRAPGCEAQPRSLAANDLDAVRSVRLPGRPYDLVIGGRWAVASLPSTAGRPALAVLGRVHGRLRLTRLLRIAPDLQPFGLHLAPGGRLLVAAGAALVAVDMRALVEGSDVEVRRLAPGRGLIGVTATADGSAAFATDESRHELVAVRTGAGAPRVTRVPLPPAPVGLALSGDQRHVFVASEFDSDWRDRGVLSVVDVRRALDGAGGAVRASAPAGCHPVRVLHDAARDVVWVSARESHAVLAFAAADLVQRPERSLRAVVPVGPSPGDLALVAGGRALAVASSDRFGRRGRRARLDLVDVRATLSGPGAPVSAIRVGRFPRAVAAAPDEDLLVASYGSRSVRAIPRAALEAAAPGTPDQPAQR